MKKNTAYDRRKRRVLFIDKKFQMSFIVSFCLLVVAGSLITMALLYALTTRSYTVAIINSRAVACTTANFLFPLLVQTVCVVSLVVGCVAAMMTLVISHRIAGPLYRFKKVMGILSAGDFSEEFRIRSKDQLQDLAKVFNDMIGTLRQRLQMLEKGIREIKRTSESIADDDITGTKKEALRDLKKMFAETEKWIRYFKLQ